MIVGRISVEVDFPDKIFPDGFFVAVHEKFGIWWDAFGSQGCAKQLNKVAIRELKVVVLQDGFK